MAPRGPKPKPKAVRDQLAPVRSKRKAAVAARVAVKVETVGAVVSAPGWLKGEARNIWDQESVGFINARLLGRTDVVSFARWCQTMADWLDLATTLQTAGQFYEVKSNHGTYIRAHPAAARMDRLETRLVALEDRFGGNPSARQRIIAARAQTPIGDLFGQGAAQKEPQPDPTEPPDTAPPVSELPDTAFLN